MAQDEFSAWIQNSPLSKRDQLFMFDEREYSYKELSEKYNMTESGVYKKKRKLYELLHQYEYKLMQKES